MFSEARFFAMYFETHILLSSVVYQKPAVSANSGKKCLPFLLSYIVLTCMISLYSHDSLLFLIPHHG